MSENEFWIKVWKITGTVAVVLFLPLILKTAFDDTYEKYQETKRIENGYTKYPVKCVKYEYAWIKSSDIIMLETE